MSQAKESFGQVTAADVRGARFPLVRRGGYDPKQVDPFLEVVAQTLEGGPLADPSINAEYIHGVRFSTVRRSGYEPTKVDAFLDRLIDTLDPLNGQNPPTALAQVKPVVRAAAVNPTQKSVETSAPAGTAPVTPVAAPAAAPAAEATGPELTPIEEGQAHLDRLRALHAAGVISDKEVAVIAQRVKRRAKEQLDAAADAAVQAS